MFTGHFAVALGGAGKARRVPLSLLIVAAFSGDLVEGLVALLRVHDPTRLWSHSVPATFATGVVLALAWKLAGGSWTDAAILLLVSLSHSALDFITAAKTYWPGTHPYGLRLYEHPAADAAVEMLLTVVGWRIWRRSLTAEKQSASQTRLMLTVLIVLQGAVLVNALVLGVPLESGASKFVR